MRMGLDSSPMSVLACATAKPSGVPWMVTAAFALDGIGRVKRNGRAGAACSASPADR
jgi:hypothetical protein